MNITSPPRNFFNANDVAAIKEHDTKKVAAHKCMPVPASESCPYCGPDKSCVAFTRNDAKYGKEYGDWSWCYICLTCSAYVGCHPNTSIPLGTLADQRTADARKAAHKAFDPLWREEWMTRKEAYKYLSQVLGIAREDCHISWFDVATCEQVVGAIAAVRQLSLDADKPKPAKSTGKPTLGDKFAQLFKGR